MAKVLIGRTAVCSHLGIAKDTYYLLLRAGMPVARLNGVALAHTEQIDCWVRWVVEQQMLGRLSPTPFYDANAIDGDPHPAENDGAKNSHRDRLGCGIVFRESRAMHETDGDGGEGPEREA